MSLPEQNSTPELSIVMPCLNEAETIEACIRKAQKAIEEIGIDAEVIVADNGSTDGSQKIARQLGARVVEVEEKGYGSALHDGITASLGKYVIMGDSDDSYDFSSIAPFVEKLREGCDLVMGNRFKGGILPGAMPWKHRWIGNPILSFIGRLFFRASPGDFHCGLRGFSREAFDRMDLRTTGMEFASEMVIKATLGSMRIAEVPTVLHPDGRSRPPHLRSWHDGWRHLRFMLLFSPRWLFLLPGALMFVGGLGISAWLVGGPRPIGVAVLDIHTLLVAAFIAIVGYQIIIFGLFAEEFAVTQGLYPGSPALERFRRWARLEFGILAGVLLLLVGFGMLVWALWVWRLTGFGALNPRHTMRFAIPAVVLMTLGTQTIFASFLFGVLGLPRR